jgi:hypothetical protein
VTDGGLPRADEVEALAERMRARGKAWSAVGRAIADGAPLPLRRALDRVSLNGDAEESAVFAQIDGWLQREAGDRRLRLAQELRAACDLAGLSARVERRSPLELRVEPFSVEVDVELDRAVLRFARLEVGRARADAAELLSARARALEALDGRPWEPAAFVARLRLAWERCGGGWTPIVEVLPELAFLLQPPSFRADPCPATFQPYGRAQLAWDLWRLRRDRALVTGGLRLCLGPATAGTVADRDGVLFLEDPSGHGQWTRTLRFSPMEEG